MKHYSRMISKVALATVALAALAAPASAWAHGRYERGADHVVFVQNDNVGGNQIVAYDRSWNGTLTQAGTYSTGGLGGMLTGSASDHLASQGSLVYDRPHGLLYAVNAGSNTISVFSVRRNRLFLREILPSGGDFPVSVTVHGNLVYVLNARSGGTVQGFRAFFNVLLPLYGSTRPLGLDPTATPEFVNTPGQVSFSPSGSQLIVTTKANGSNIDVFGVRWDGRLSQTPVVNNEPGAVPFAIDFDSAGHLVIAEAGTNALATFTLNGDGTVTPIASQPNGQMATCWVTDINGVFYVSSTASSGLSIYSENPADGTIGIPTTITTDPGTTDASPTPDGRYLYVQTGINGIVDEYRVNPDHSLTEIGSITVPDAIGGQGIVAS